MKSKKVTFADIARYTHFSKTTISRYFNNPDSLTLENQQIIARALEELDYKENKVGRILANGKTEIVGIIVPNLYFPTRPMAISFWYLQATPTKKPNGATSGSYWHTTSRE